MYRLERKLVALVLTIFILVVAASSTMVGISLHRITGTPYCLLPICAQLISRLVCSGRCSHCHDEILCSLAYTKLHIQLLDSHSCLRNPSLLSRPLERLSDLSHTTTNISTEPKSHRRADPGFRLVFLNVRIRYKSSSF